jgi:hypothetical protein
MQRAEVRIVEPQQEQTTSVEIYGSEADALLAKYGFKSQPTQIQQPIRNQNPNSELTVDELFMIQQREIEQENQRRYQNSQQRNNPNGYSENKFATIEGTDFGIQIQVVSDMPLYNNNRY